MIYIDCCAWAIFSIWRDLRFEQHTKALPPWTTLVFHGRVSKTLGKVRVSIQENPAISSIWKQEYFTVSLCGSKVLNRQSLVPLQSIIIEGIIYRLSHSSLPILNLSITQALKSFIFLSSDIVYKCFVWYQTHTFLTYWSSHTVKEAVIKNILKNCENHLLLFYLSYLQYWKKNFQ